MGSALTASLRLAARPAMCAMRLALLVAQAAVGAPGERLGGRSWHRQWTATLSQHSAHG